ncbi:hypothetical protein CFSAN000509_001469 [Salmonella bongori CFSAN000509]|uniref:Uncharacterized protein n=1 Tax=Salmonella bongori serovar 44:r:- TaxID=1967585 RepID=A0A702BN61_SALBN|nr:hypothetical protein [Salmonella bongori CFSAN000509]HAC6694888.1 hypothetical protein [Salmonella bongori serovar 44:r:-]
MSQLNEKRRLLYWKFCRTIRVNPEWGDYLAVSSGISSGFILTVPGFFTRVLRMLTKINNIYRRFPL